jgi:hypothetical protein
MSKKVKILGAVGLAFLLLICGVVYYASTKLDPEDIRKMAIDQTQKIFPKSTVELERVEIAWGFNFQIQLKNFKMVTNNPEGAAVEMMAVDELLVKVPLWAILTNGGVIEIKLDKPLMNYAEFPVGNNWTHAMGDTTSKTPEEKSAEETKKAAESQESAIGLFGKSKINVKLSDVAVKYALRDNSSGQIKVARFLVKGLNFETSTAFEIASDAEFNMADKSKVSFSTIAIGEINIADLVKNGSVTSLVIVKVSNIAKTGLEWKFPDVTTNINLLLKKDGEISGDLLTSFESQNKISAKFKMTKEIEISDISVDIILKDIGLVMGLDRTIDLSKSKLTAKGKILYTEDKKIDADLSFAIAPGIGYSHEGLVATTSVSGEFKKKEIAIRVKTDVLGGVVNTLVNGEYDPNQKFDMKTLKPFDIKVTASGMKIPEKLIQAKLWAKQDPAEIVKAQEKALEEEKKKEVAQAQGQAPPGSLPPSSTTLHWSSINIGGEDFSGHGKIVTSSNAIAVDNLNFKYSKGTGKITQTMKLGLKSNDSVFNLEISELNLSSFKAFLPPFIENFAGVFSGKINGSTTMFKTTAKPARFDVNVAVDAKKGEIKKLNIGEFINPLLANIPMVKDKVGDKPIKLDGNFETLNMKGRFTNEEYLISAFTFLGMNKKIEITGSGGIYPLPGSKSSSMDVYFTEHEGKVAEILQKNIGTKTLPIRLGGPGFGLKPDYQFTVSRVAKSAVKTKGEEVAKKIIDKNIDKIVPPEAKDKVKGLLNSLFKKK